MKKVGIVTLLGNNYGGVLQGFALKKCIEKKGFEVVQFKNELNKKWTLKEILKVFIYGLRNYKFMKYKKRFFNIKDLEKCDYYIAGSDQIWNPQIPFEQRKMFYLDFADKNKIAYAASIGREKIEYSEENIAKIKKYLEDFRGISVREQKAKEILNNLIQNDVEVVLVPTLLLEKEEWDNHLLEPKENIEYIFTYFLGGAKKIKNVVNDFAQKNNYKIIDLFFKKEYKNLYKCKNTLSPQEFIGYIKNSQIVITNSFHGMVFSIIFHKPFYIITRGDMNSRIYDLLSLLDLSEYIIKEEEIEELLKKKIKKPDYRKVDKILNEERNKAHKFLNKTLDIEGE